MWWFSSFAEETKGRSQGTSNVPKSISRTARSARRRNAPASLAKVARKAHLTREATYKMLSRTGNPELRSLSAILRATGLRIAVKPIGKRAP